MAAASPKLCYPKPLAFARLPLLRARPIASARPFTGPLPPDSIAVKPATASPPAVSVPPCCVSFEQVLEQLIVGAHFSEHEAEATLQLLLNEENEARIAAFLMLLCSRGETFEEIVGLAKAMMNNCICVDGLDNAVDIVGTGGDGSDTVNISTDSTILADAKVAKHI